MDCGQIVTTVMIDLSKAFDTINHNLLPWFIDYLAERKMRVVVDRVSSEWARVSMGKLRVPYLGRYCF